MRRWLGLLLWPLVLVVLGCSTGGAPATAPGRLAYVGSDGQVYTLPLEGGEPRRVSGVPGETPVPAGERFTRWPTWARDGQRWAFMRFEVSRVAEDRATVYVVG